MSYYSLRLTERQTAILLAAVEFAERYDYEFREALDNDDIGDCLEGMPHVDELGHIADALEDILDIGPVSREVTSKYSRDIRDDRED